MAMDARVTRRTVFLGAGGALALVIAGRARVAAQEAASISVEGLVAKPRTWTAEELAALPQETVSGAWSDVNDGAPFTARGPKLQAVLAASEPNVDRETASRTVVVITGRDGYESVFAWGEIAADLSDVPVILALEMDGKPLEADRGPAQAVNPNDSSQLRAVFEIATVEVRDLGGGSAATPAA